MFFGGFNDTNESEKHLVLHMIRLIGVLSEGGISVQVKSSEATRSDMLVGALIEATKTLSSTISSGHVLNLDFREQKLLITESEKGYTIVALVDRAEAYMDTLIKIIAQDIDRSKVPPADGVVTDLHKDLVCSILDTYVKHELDISLRDVLEDTWNPILETLKKNPTHKQILDDMERTVESAELVGGWNRLQEETESSLDAALEYARNGEFDKACVASFKHEEPIVRLFALKMGVLAFTMTKTRAPPREILRGVTDSIPENGIYQLGNALVGRITGEIAPIDYEHSFEHAIKNFQIEDTRDGLLQAFLLIDARVGDHPEFAQNLSDLFKAHNFDVICSYLDAVVERSTLFQKLYSMTSMDDFKDELSLWRIKIGRTIELLDNVVKGVENLSQDEIIRSGQTGSLQLQNYITLLTAIAESPVLSIGERRGILREVLSLYNMYFRKLLNLDIPLFTYTIDSVFQSLSVAYAEYYHLTTGNEKDQNLAEIADFLHDIVLVMEADWTKLRGRFSLDVFMNAISPVLTMAGELHHDEIKLILASLKTLEISDIDALRILDPMTFATNVGNIMMALSSLAVKVLDEDTRAKALSSSLSTILSVHQYFMTQGLVCRDDIIALTYLTSESVNLFDDIQLKHYVDIVETLNRISIQDKSKHDYEVAMMGFALLSLLTKSWKQTKNEHLREEAQEILEIAIGAWKKYGFHEKAKEFEQVFGHIKQ